jgi:non-heme chloroperoxidase
MPQSRFAIGAAALLVSFLTHLDLWGATQWKDPSPHTVRFVTTDDNVRLEVLDWGGSGRPLVLLAGGGDTAHVFDDFAPRLTAHNHVYAVTRRGFGASGYAESANVGERLGQDVLAVIDALGLNKPILAGHSVAGAELSWVATTHPNRIAGLLYLEAGYSYAFDNGDGAAVADMMKLQAPQPPPPVASDLVSFTALQKYDERVNGFRYPEAELREERQARPDGSVGEWRNPPGGAMLMKLISGGRKYTRVSVPALFIFANPHGLGTWVDSNPDASVRSSTKAYEDALSILTEKQETSIEHNLPTARIITLPGANHFVFLSNESVVLRYISEFVAELP